MKKVKDLIKESTGYDAIVLNRLMGGMSNSTYVVEIDSTKYTFRIPGKKAEVFVDRVDEEKNIEVVDSLGINNETVYLNLNNGYKLAKFVEGTPLNELDDLHLDEVASLLKKLHESKLRFEKDYAPFERLDYYESLNDLSDEYYDTLVKFKKYKEYLLSFPNCMCHNDSQKSNIVIGEKNYLLDWEFAGNNDPFYDIACFGNVDYNDALALLEVYLGKKPNQDEYNHLALWRTFQCLQWHNVALYKHKIGLSEELQVPFDKVATAYLEKANTLLGMIK